MKYRGSRQLETIVLVSLSVEACLVSSFFLPVLCSELKHAPRIPLTENRTKNMALTDNEKQIAKELGFDEAVLLLIKERLNPEMGIVKSGGLEWEEKSFLQEDYNQPARMLDKDLKNYHDIASKYPELKKIVEFELPKDKGESLAQNIYKSDSMEREELGPEKFERMKKYRIAAEPYQALIAQELHDTFGKPKGGVAYRPDTPMTYLDSDKALNEAIAELHTKYDGKTLRPENKAKLILGLKYKGVGDHFFGPDRRMAALQAELQELGYRIADERGVSLARMHFETKAEAEKCLLDAGMTVDTLGCDRQKKLQYKAIYPIDFTKDISSLEDAKTIIVQSSFFIDRENEGTTKLAKMLMENPSLVMATVQPGLRLLPGSTVTKLGDRHWLIDRPERFIVSPMLRVSTVFKTPKGSSGFEMVKAKCTSGINYGIDNDHVIEKLKYWDKKYGVTVVEATFEGMKISFKKLPDDLSELCTEFFLFCPEIELSDDEHRNAAVMREIADKFRKTKVMSFWWD